MNVYGSGVGDSYIHGTLAGLAGLRAGAMGVGQVGGSITQFAQEEHQRRLFEAQRNAMGGYTNMVTESELQTKNRENLAAWRVKWEAHQTRVAQEIDAMNANAVARPKPRYTCRDCGDVEVSGQSGQCRDCYRTFDEGRDGDE